MGVFMSTDPFEYEHDLSHIWRDDATTAKIVENIDKRNQTKYKNMTKDLTCMSKQLKDALDMEMAFKAYIIKKEEYCRKYGVKIAYPSSEVERLQVIINSDDDKPLTSNKHAPKLHTSSDSELLL